MLQIAKVTQGQS